MSKRKAVHESEGYIPINRKFFSHPFWREKRTFSKSEAWLDLISSARFDESKVNELIGGRLVSWSRGQLPASLRYLSERWTWSKNKVSDFLELLEREGMIKRDDKSGQTIISLCNYEAYNKKGQQKGHVSDYDSGDSGGGGDSKGDSRGTAKGQRGDKDNKENKGNKGEECAPAPADLEKFKAFTDWIQKHAPNVSKMKEPFTIDQYLQMRKKYGQPIVQDLLLKMHNWKPLTTKNTSAYLTLCNWSKRDYNQSSTIPPSSNSTIVV